jgi:GT2 family glycosyltransferase
LAEKVSVVIPNWNGAHWLRPCLDSLKLQTYDDFKVYVVDNGSEDNSVVLMETEYPWVQIIRNSENLGFAGGMNSGICVAQGELIVALNNDTEVAADWLSVLVAAMDANPNAGTGASQLMDFKDRCIIDSLGDGYLPIGTSFKVGAGRKYSSETMPVREVQSACAAASVYRQNMLEEIGLFDEDFFAYMEDIDLGLRAQSAGYDCIFIPNAKVFHIGSATSGGTASAFSIRQTVCNTYQVIIKNVPTILVPVYVILTFCAQITALLISFFPGKLDWLAKNRHAFWAGIWNAMQESPKSFRKRRAFKPLRRRGLKDFVGVTFATMRANFRFKA